MGGPLNEISGLSSIFSETGLNTLLGAVEKTHPYMPPFAGTKQERQALAHYIAYSLNGQRESRDTVDIQAVPAEIPAFSDQKDEYVLLAWSDRGMRSMTDNSKTWMMLPPGVTLRASLIHRGETPEVVTRGVELEYAVAAEFKNPAAEVDFWEQSEALYGKNIPVNTGLSGSTLKGIMEVGESTFSADLLPLVPYTDQGNYLPYPTVSITAKDENGTVLAQTTVVAPVATELGCRNCHAGPWRVQNRAGISTVTAENVLTAHDRLSGTRLFAEAQAGRPVLCQKCHQEQQSGSGDPLNMSAAIHGFHANFLNNQGAGACTSCHPASEDGATRAFRGMHHTLELDCTSCHGELADHALSLLKGELEQGKNRAETLISRLTPVVVADVSEIVSRTPWINEPDCLNCHEEFQAPENDQTFNRWTTGRDELFSNRTDESGQLYCAGCHNSAHAIYPAVNPYNEELDVLQPLQYQGAPLPIGSNRNCAVCHTIPMEEEMHHPNMLREFRNQ